MIGTAINAVITRRSRFEACGRAGLFSAISLIVALAYYRGAVGNKESVNR